MPAFTPTLNAMIATQHGVVTRQQLVTDGVTRDQIRRFVSEGSISRCHDGVYRMATSPDTFESRCTAVCFADPSIVVTGVAAARLWGFRHIKRSERPVVLVEHDRHPVSCAATVRRTNVLDEEDRVRRKDGIVLASPPRAWFDCARDLEDDAFEALTEWVLDHHAAMPTLWRTVRRLDNRGRPGLARVKRVVSQRSAWQKPAGSRLELRVLKALHRAGLPELVRQHRLRLPNGVVILPDGADPSNCWAVEIDHVTWHGGRVDAQRDKGRDRGLRRIGWQVERVTDRELADDFDGVIAEVAELHALRSATAA